MSSCRSYNKHIFHLTFLASIVLYKYLEDITTTLKQNAIRLSRFASIFKAYQPFIITFTILYSAILLGTFRFDNVDNYNDDL